MRHIEAGDEARVREAQPFFDGPVREAALQRFLSSPDHHLLVAYAGDQAAGFVSGVETTHPDKGTEMLLYELAVGPLYRRRGCARALVAALLALAKKRGCYGMWVATEPDNAAARATYASAGGDEAPVVHYAWTF